MKEKNICKFITDSAIERLNVRLFIYESDQEQIKKVQTTKNNRLMLIKCGFGKFFADGVSVPFRAGSVIVVFEGEKFISNLKRCVNTFT